VVSPLSPAEVGVGSVGPQAAVAPYRTTGAASRQGLNGLEAVTREAVEAARELLVIDTA
jgi:hypothetical protein